MEQEEWKDIPGYEGLYQVSSFGNVRSLNYRRTGQVKLLKPSTSKNGYHHIILSKNLKQKGFCTHQLVAITFLNHTPDGFNLVINHIDHNKLNNNINNLEIVTTRYNSTEYKNNPGVCYHKIKNRYMVSVTINNKHIFIGYYHTLEEANRIYQLASQNVHLYDGDNSKFRQLIKTGSDV